MTQKYVHCKLKKNETSKIPKIFECSRQGKCSHRDTAVSFAFQRAKRQKEIMDYGL